MNHNYHRRNMGNGGNTLVGMILGAAATVGAYFLLKDRISPEHKERMKEWMRRMKDEVEFRAGDMRDKSEEAYHKLVDTVGEKYEKYRDVDTDDFERFVRKLKAKWRAFREAGEEEQ